MPDALEEPEAFVRRVRELLRATSAAVLLPATDASMAALLTESHVLTETVIPFGPECAYRALSDKESVWNDARDLGLSVPEQRVVREPNSRDADVPWNDVVVKPARSVAGSRHRRSRFSVRYASKGDDLRAVLDSMDHAAFPVLVQKRIQGSGVGVFLLRWDEETRAVFAHRRLREKPPEGGVSVYRESIEAPPELVDACERLLARHGWRGVAMVEFKLDAASGTPYLMEVNPRFWGSLQLAIDAGVDFPRLLVEAALGSAKAEIPSYQVGVRTRWWWGDVDHLIARLNGAVPADGSAGGPERMRAVFDFLRLWRWGDRYEVLQPSDSMPFLRETSRWMANAWR